MAHFIPTQTQINAPDLAKLFLDNIVRIHGFPRSIVSDCDSRFLSNFWRELFSLTNTTLRFSTANHPQTDRQTERTNRTLEQYLRIHARHNPSSWSRYLVTAELAYNNITHFATGMSPFYLVFQRHVNLPLDFALSDLQSKNAAVKSLLNARQKVLNTARDSLIKACNQMIAQNKHKTLPPPFKLHDMVLVHKAAFRKQHHISDLNKFDDRWFGPYEIIRLINLNAYALDLPSYLKHHNVLVLCLNVLLSGSFFAYRNACSSWSSRCATGIPTLLIIIRIPCLTCYCPWHRSHPVGRRRWCSSSCLSAGNSSAVLSLPSHRCQLFCSLYAEAITFYLLVLRGELEPLLICRFHFELELLHALDNSCLSFCLDVGANLQDQ